MESNKIKKYMKEIVPILNSREIECSSIHKKAKHKSHRRCFVLGIDATEEVMSTEGGKGSYFYLEDKGKIHQQYFTQQPEGHDWGEDKIITESSFFSYIKKLPTENMANPREVFSRLERAFNDG